MFDERIQPVKLLQIRFENLNLTWHEQSCCSSLLTFGLIQQRVVSGGGGLDSVSKEKMISIHDLVQCFSAAGSRSGTGPCHQLYGAARDSPGIDN